MQIKLQKENVLLRSSNNLIIAVNILTGGLVFKHAFRDSCRFKLVSDVLYVLAEQLYCVSLDSYRIERTLAVSYFGICGLFQVGECIVVCNPRRITVFSGDFSEILQLLEFDCKVVAWPCGDQVCVCSNGTISVI